MSTGIGTPNVTITVEADGTEHVVDFLDVPFVRWKQLKAQTGLTPRDLIYSLGALDPDAVAGAIWLARVAEEPKLTVSRVAQGLTIRSITNVDLDEHDPDEAPTDPPTPSGAP